MLPRPSRARLRLVVTRLRRGRAGSLLDAVAAASRFAGIQAVQPCPVSGGRRARTRTWDPLLRRQMLYPTELRARSIFIVVQRSACVRLRVPLGELKNAFRCQAIIGPPTLTRQDLSWFQLVCKPVRDVVDKRWY